MVLTEGESRCAELRSRSHTQANTIFELPSDDRLHLRDLLARVLADSPQ